MSKRRILAVVRKDREKVIAPTSEITGTCQFVIEATRNMKSTGVSASYVKETRLKNHKAL